MPGSLVFTGADASGRLERTFKGDVGNGSLLLTNHAQQSCLDVNGSSIKWLVMVAGSSHTAVLSISAVTN